MAVLISARISSLSVDISPIVSLHLPQRTTDN